MPPPSGTAAPPAPPPETGVVGRAYVLGQGLAAERQRNAALQAKLEQRTREIAQRDQEAAQHAQEIASLHSEIDQLRSREATLQAALTRAGAAPAAAPARQAARPEDGASSGLVAHLRQLLVHEQQRRQQVETQLARLKQETSTPPFATAAGRPPDASAAALASAQQEIGRLRHALQEEHDARTQLAAQLAALQPDHPPPATGTPGAQPDPGLRARLTALEAEKQQLVDSFKHSLEASQKRTADLERELTQARVAAAKNGGGELASVRAENDALRARLEEEHRRTEDLAKKLKVASRVTDLIFKMRSQQNAAAPGSAAGSDPPEER